MNLLHGKGKLDDRICDYSCEYCGYDYQHHRNCHQYLQDFKEISIKKDRNSHKVYTVYFDL